MILDLVEAHEPVGEVVEHDHLAARGEERPRQLRAEVPGAAGDEDVHHALAPDCWRARHGAR
ncbi:hypothetical protein BJF78_19570 [Pseudonocardia sp. CNS-139]|nr:hypothetical protein BJF78_19570 [Pseudonocardia sp. CNS-139]